MREETVKVLKIDTGDSKETIEELSKKLSELRTELGKLNRDTEEYESTVRKIVETQKELNKILDDSKKSLNELSKETEELRKATKSVDDLGDSVEKLNKEGKEFSDVLEDIEKNSSEASKGMSRTAQAADSIEKEFDDAINVVTQLKESWEKASDDIEKSKLEGIITDVSRSFKELDENASITFDGTGDSIDDVIDNLENLKQEFSQTDDAVRRNEIGENIKKVNRQLASINTLGLVNTGENVKRSARDIVEEMGKIAYSSDLADKDTEEYQQTIRTLIPEQARLSAALGNTEEKYDSLGKSTVKASHRMAMASEEMRKIARERIAIPWESRKKLLDASLEGVEKRLVKHPNDSRARHSETNIIKSLMKGANKEQVEEYAEMARDVARLTEAIQSLDEESEEYIDTLVEINDIRTRMKEMVLSFEKPETKNTVKSYKDEIRALQDSLLNMEKGSKEYAATVEKLQEKQRRLNEVLGATKKNAVALDGSYDALTFRMARLKDEWRSTDDEDRRNELGKEIDEINTKLKDMDASIGNFQRNVGDYTNSIVEAFDKLNQEIGEFENKAAQALNDGDMKAYAQAIEEIGKRQANVDKINRDSDFANGNLYRQLENLSGIASGVASGFEIVQSVMVLTGSESENLEKAMVKLQATIALVQGLSGIEGLVKSLTGLRRSIRATSKLAKKAISGISKGGWVGIIVAATAALGGLIYKMATADKTSEVFEKSIDNMTDSQKRLNEAREHSNEELSREIELMTKSGQITERKALLLEKAARVGQRKVQQGVVEDVTKEYNAVKNEKNSSEELIQKAREAKEEAEAILAEIDNEIAEYDHEIALYDAEQKNNAINIRKRAEDSLKSEIELLTRKYEEELELLRKHGEDTTALTQEYQDKINSILLQEPEDIEDTEIEDNELNLEEGYGDAAALANAKMAQAELEMKQKMNKAILEDDAKRYDIETTLILQFYERKKQILDEAIENEKDPEALGDLMMQRINLEIEAEAFKNGELKRLRDEDKESRRANTEEIMNITMGSLDAIGNALGGVAELYQANAEAQVKAGKMTEKEYEKEMKKVKGIQIAQATIQTIQGAIGAFMQANATIPPPWGAIIGGIQAAAVTAVGIAQISKIKNTDISGSGNVPSVGGTSVTPPQLPNQQDTNVIRKLTGNREIDELNKDQRVFIVESDLEESRRRVQVRESESTF